MLEFELLSSFAKFSGFQAASDVEPWSICPLSRQYTCRTPLVVIVSVEVDPRFEVSRARNRFWLREVFFGFQAAPA